MIDLEKVIEQHYCHHLPEGVCSCPKKAKECADVLEKAILEELPKKQTVNDEYIVKQKTNLTQEAKEANAFNFGYNICLAEVRAMFEVKE